MTSSAFGGVLSRVPRTVRSRRFAPRGRRMGPTWPHTFHFPRGPPSKPPSNTIQMCDLHAVAV
eukprot:scaffold19601_cov98-Skeletonema_menzelii.AAC.1